MSWIRFPGAAMSQSMNATGTIPVPPSRYTVFFGDRSLWQTTSAPAASAVPAAKYHYLVWRPITAIQLGSTANNPGIVGDPTWNPLAVTAADPSYPGAHATISQAAATVLSAFYGDHQWLSVSSDGDPGVTRTFGSFQAAANEATLSRIFAGQHTIIDEATGQQLGRHVADFVLHHLGSAPADAR